MKSICVFALTVIAVCSGDGGYTSDKGLDITVVLNDLPTLTAFVECFSDQAECNDQAAALKKDLPEALQQACAKCTPEQKHNVKAFLDALKNKLPDKYDGFRNKYDAENKYFNKLEAAVSAY